MPNDMEIQAAKDKQLLQRLKNAQMLEKISNDEKAPETAAATKELIERLRQPVQEQVDLSPLLALASPHVAQQLSRAIENQREPLSMEEQRLKIASDKELSLPQARNSNNSDELRRAELVLKAIKEDRLERGFSWKKAENDELTSKEVDKITGLDDIEAELKEIEELKKGVNTGPMVEYYQKLREKVGPGKDPKYAALETRTGQNLFKYVHGISGTAFTAKELEMLQNQVPSMNQDDKTFNEKMQIYKDIIKKGRERYIRNLQQYKGKNIPNILEDNLNNIDKESKVQKALKLLKGK